MKSLRLIVVLLALSFSLNAQGDNRRDGNWWIAQAPDFKVAYMTGFFDGMELGKNFGFWKFADESNCVSKHHESYEFYRDKYLNHVTNGQIADGLDVFYKDYRNRKITVSDGVWLTLLAIAGTPQADLDKRIENFRKSAQ
jgi:hypothetical protein